MTAPLIQVDGLVKHFPTGGLFGRGGAVRAVDGVSFEIAAGETLGLVGESGCGKTTTGRAILRLIEPTAGAVLVDGEDLLQMSRAELRAMRRRLQIIFQDPYSSLNPRMSVEKIIGEGLAIHGIGTPGERRGRVLDLLDRVGLADGEALLGRYPHEFSGGQRQRIGIARALAVEPRFIVCDEPVSALDVSVQAQIVNLLAGLQDELGLGYLFISHDLGVVEHIAHRVAVMYLGQIVELATVASLYENPRHPYTQALFSAIPTPDPKAERKRIILSGEPPSAINPPPGCRFHPRCPHVMDRCKSEAPPLYNVADGHVASCFLVEEQKESAGGASADV